MQTNEIGNEKESNLAVLVPGTSSHTEELQPKRPKHKKILT